MGQLLNISRRYLREYSAGTRQLESLLEPLGDLQLLVELRNTSASDKCEAYGQMALIAFHYNKVKKIEYFLGKSQEYGEDFICSVILTFLACAELNELKKNQKSSTLMPKKEDGIEKAKEAILIATITTTDKFKKKYLGAKKVDSERYIADTELLFTLAKTLLEFNAPIAEALKFTLALFPNHPEKDEISSEFACDKNKLISKTRGLLVLI